MELGNLSALFWGLLAVPIVIFYILKIRLRRAPVSTLMFWDQIYEESRPRSIWQQLRHLLSLLVQLLFLSLLVFALMDPIFSWEKLRAQRIVLVVDNSASMNATDVAPNRLAVAKQQGRRQIRGLRHRDEMAIVSAGSVPRVQCGLTGHQRTLRDALDAVPATDGPTGVAAAVTLARRLLADHDNTKIVILSDECFAEASDFAAAEDVVIVPAGGKAENVAITQFQVRRSLIDPIGYQILVEVINFSEQPIQCRLEIELGGAVVDVVPLKLAAEEHFSKTLDQTSAEGGRLVARIDHQDALAADNRAVALLPQTKRQPVLLVTDGSLFLQRVFEAIPIVDLTMTDTLPQEVSPEVLVVYHRQSPEQLPSGNVLVIDPAGPSDLWTLGGPLENPIVAKQKSDSPLMTHVRLDNVLMPGAKKLIFSIEPEVLVASIDEDPLFCTIERPQGKVLLLNVNLAKGDLPLRTAFPIMITNAIGWFQGNQGELREAISTGRVIDVDLSSLVSSRDTEDVPEVSFVLLSPDGKPRPLPGNVTQTTIGPLDQCGVWRIERRPAKRESEMESDCEPILEFACNLSNAQECDLRPAKEFEQQAPADVFGFGGRPLWFYLIVAALLLAAVEWCLYQRRWIS
ncbi:MAG: BatA and WFA domain-containing protein [Thermoguttaceae bacterium]